MSNSTWQFSGMDWVRWLLVWSCFFSFVIGITQFSPADAGTPGPAGIETQGAALPSVESATSAGKLIVHTVAAFDFNSTQPAVYGDNEPAASGQ